MRHIVGALAFLVVAIFPAAADTLGFSNFKGTSLTFTGNGTPGANFTMTTALNGIQQVGFEVTLASDPSDLGLFGSISGSYQYKDSQIVTSNSGLTETAPVIDNTGPFTFTIWDSTGGGGSAFTANIAWITIMTTLANGGLNSGGTINLTNLHYTGSNSGLQSLAGNANGVVTASFTFSAPTSLTELESGTHTTTYSGSLTAPDGGMTLMLLGGALLGLESLRRRFRT